ncbi:methyltransferase [Mycobacterium phage Leperchaun]|nr:methyltransferase [Mycobacterium phage Leperchaun]
MPPVVAPASPRAGTRSGLWALFAEVINQLRPGVVVIENVRGLLSARAYRAMESEEAAVGDGADGPVLRALGAVLGDLADLGYDAQWITLAASDVGAPHRRERVFILATPVASSASLGELARGASAQETGTQPSDGSGDHRREQPAGDSDGHQNTLPGTVRDLLPTPSASDGTGGGQHPDRREGHSRQLCDYALLDGTSRWGKYAAAIARWEAVAGPAPSPTEPNKNGNPRLTAAFPEWMMGWPAGWVTAVPGISRNDALRICGNGVCPQQAYAALQILVRVSACEVAE